MSNLARMIIGLGWCFISLSIYAKPTLGTCTNYFKPPLLKEDGQISTTLAVRVLRHDAPVYSEETADKIKENLAFGDSLEPLKLGHREQQQRIQVMKPDSTQPSGWMDSSDLLCAFSPLVNDKGIEQKLFIKTPPSTEKNPQSVTAYPSPNDTRCDPKQGIICKQLSRFELFFIFADDPETRRYLLVDEFDITGYKPLIGWVDYDKGIHWNTVLGLRPQENITAYSTPPTDKAEAKPAIEIQGGKIWYDRSRIAERIPLLEIDQPPGYYHIAAAGIGMPGFETLDTQVLETMKQVDVFFLLDGTTSMGPYIQSATSAAKKIVNTLRNNTNFIETSFRFGFRVYRDVFADAIRTDCHGGICEGMPLAATTCHLDTTATYDNWVKFDEQLSQVKETTADQDDFPEQLFAGLEHALQDVASCKDRTKLLFVIGDHGDAQPQLPPQLLQQLKQFHKLIIFFIQTPPATSQSNNPQQYLQAYHDFQNQAQAIIKLLIPAKFKGQKINRREYLLSLNQTQLVDKVLDLVKFYSESAIVNEVAQQIRGGDSLENIINKWLAKGDMPVLYWQLLDKAACQQLGKQCQNSIDHRVIDAYIPTQAKVAEEIRLTAIQLDEWRAILRRLSDVKIRPVEDQRLEFIKILRQEIQDILGKPPVYTDEEQTLTELMKRKTGLPMRNQSPLLQYSLKEIEEIPRCELRRLITWVDSMHQVLNNVRSAPTLKVSFTLKPYPPEQCPLATPKGKAIPELVFDPPQKMGETEEYRYDRSFRGQVIYWLPIEFLP
ncbi:hypothetical protein THII_2737 [Thioploca ingrica]|uniref:VWFA domain-containing protein n=1 Tax=Thioploca ingrica TaxID=40754 RepID=A0A090AI63_9GAMM|nr:hypothetical protein THII_2737 [Thioploca ingrica]